MSLPVHRGFRLSDSSAPRPRGMIREEPHGTGQSETHWWRLFVAISRTVIGVPGEGMNECVHDSD
jgi:hypothetical protein